MVHFGFLFWGLDQGAAALRHARDVIASLPPDVNVVVGGLNAPPAPFVPEQHRLQPRLRDGGSSASARRRSTQRSSARPNAPYPARRLRLADAVRRAPEDARRGQRVGLFLLRQGLLRRGALGRPHRRPRRTLPAEGFAALHRPVLPPRRRLLCPRRGRHRVQRRPARRGSAWFIIGVCPAPRCCPGEQA